MVSEKALNNSPAQLAASILEGNRLALARLLTYVENGTRDGMAALDTLFPATGRAHLVGVTGPPGTGKSSLVNQLARFFRKSEVGSSEEDTFQDDKARRVAVVAIDPSSPFTGGAILGDRVRMRDLSGDPGVFIRSMASRGSLGGLAKATAGVVQVLDAAGFDLILIETVGAGQAEVDIARLAHTVLVIEAPGMGDDIQAIKAGILEIADILVVNKADRPGADATERALRGMLQLAHPAPRVFQHHGRAERVEPAGKLASDPAAGDLAAGDSAGKPGQSMWIPPILKTVATEGKGIPEIGRAIDRHARHLRETGEWESRDQSRLQSELDLLLQDALVSRWRSRVSQSRYQAVLDHLAQREISPRQALADLLDGDNP